MANLFGCHDDESVIEQLCDLSDLADNVRTALVNSDLATASQDMSLTVETFEKSSPSGSRSTRSPRLPLPPPTPAPAAVGVG